MAGQHQDRGGAAGGPGGRDVAPGIADQGAQAKLEFELPRGAQQHARLRLAAIAVHGVITGARGAMVRAVIQPVEPRAFGRQHAAKRRMDFPEPVLVQQAARHAGLVGDQDDRHPALVHPPDRRRRPGQQPQIFDAPQIFDLLDHHAVAVEEQGGKIRGRAVGHCRFGSLEGTWQ